MKKISQTMPLRPRTGKPLPPVSHEIRKLLARGFSNAEIWRRVQPRYNMPDSHRYYPAWFRRDERIKSLEG